MILRVQSKFYTAHTAFGLYVQFHGDFGRVEASSRRNLCRRHYSILTG